MTRRWKRIFWILKDVCECNSLKKGKKCKIESCVPIVLFVTCVVHMMMSYLAFDDVESLTDESNVSPSCHHLFCCVSRQQLRQGRDEWNLILTCGFSVPPALTHSMKAQQSCTVRRTLTQQQTSRSLPAFLFTWRSQCSMVCDHKQLPTAREREAGRERERWDHWVPFVFVTQARLLCCVVSYLTTLPRSRTL